LLLAICYLLLATCYLLLATCYLLLATYDPIMTNNYRSIYPQKLNQEFIDIVANLYQIENQIKTCIEKQKNELNNLSRECQNNNKNIIKELNSDR
jgi:hypothetical protein